MGGAVGGVVMGGAGVGGPAMGGAGVGGLAMDGAGVGGPTMGEAGVGVAAMGKAGVGWPAVGKADVGRTATVGGAGDAKYSLLMTFGGLVHLRLLFSKTSSRKRRPFLSDEVMASGSSSVRAPSRG
jgi:hypothetical protein